MDILLSASQAKMLQSVVTITHTIENMTYNQKQHCPDGHEDREEREVGIRVDGRLFLSNKVHDEADYERDEDTSGVELHPAKIESHFFSCSACMCTCRGQRASKQEMRRGHLTVKYYYY